MRLGLVIGAVMALAGCSAADSAGGDGDYMDDDLPMGNCSGGSGGACPADSGNVPAGFPCGGTRECSGDLACVATFEDQEVGEFLCSAQCIPTEDEAWWCIDAEGCCDPAATCTPRGLCIVPEGLDDTAGSTTIGGTSASGSTGIDPTGSDTGSESGSGSGTAGSDSGGSSGSSTGGG